MKVTFRNIKGFSFFKSIFNKHIHVAEVIDEQPENI